MVNKISLRCKEKRVGGMERVEKHERVGREQGGGKRERERGRVEVRICNSGEET